MDIVGFMLLSRYRVLAARGRPTIDPWGFLLPLTPMVWMGLLTTLLGIMGMILVLRQYWLFQSPDIASRRIVPFSCVRIILQQGKKGVHRHLELNTYVFWKGVYLFCRNIVTNHFFSFLSGSGSSVKRIVLQTRPHQGASFRSNPYQRYNICLHSQSCSPTSVL